MIGITVEVTLADGSTLVAKPKVGDAVRFESHFNMRYPEFEEALKEGKASLTNLLFPVWSYLERNGKVAYGFAEFCDQVETFDFKPPESVSADPTNTALSVVASSS